MEIGLSTRECDPWATYSDALTRKLKGHTDLTETETKIYEFVKSKGRATRAEVMEGLGMSELDLRNQLIPLMHSELIKERSEGDNQYLVPIG